MEQNTLSPRNTQSELDHVLDGPKLSRRRPSSLGAKAPTIFPDSEKPDDSRSLLYHAYTLYLFTCNNLKDIVILGYSFGVLGAVCSPVFGFGPSLSLVQILRRTPSMLLWSWTNLLLFNLHNQRHADAIQEDSINKAWRPLPSKRLSPTSATRLMYCMYPIVILTSLYLGGMGPCLLEMISCIWYNEWRGAETPLLKNLLNGGGFACFLAGPLEVLVLGPGTSLLSYPRATYWLLLIALAISLTSHTQDFRDVAGDRLRGRRTVPLAIGDAQARWLVVAAVVACSALAPVFWEMGLEGLVLPAGTGAAMVFNLMWKRSVEGDVWTWKLWPVWITSFFFVPLIKMGKGGGMGGGMGAGGGMGGGTG